MADTFAGRQKKKPSPVGYDRDRSASVKLNPIDRSIQESVEAVEAVEEIGVAGCWIAR